jgi:hypothetical protein
MSTPRLYYSSNLLSNGKLFVLGGEYSGPNRKPNWTNTGEIYDPVANTWTPIAPFPQANYGDEPSMLMPNGTSVLLGTGALAANLTYIYDALTNTYTPTSTTVNPDSTDEEGYVKLSNGNVLRYNVFTSVLNNNGNNAGFAEIFNTQTNTWQDISPANGTANGSIPLLSDINTFELGPTIRLQDGRILVIGDGASNGATAFYDPSTNTWSAGPNIMGTDANGNTVPFGADDAPAAELPNGEVIFAADPGVFYNTLGLPPQELFIFNPANNTISPLPPPPEPAPTDFSSSPAFIDRMLMLPTGQLLFSDFNTQMWIYTPQSTQADPQYRPVIYGITQQGKSNSFTLTGAQLNGQSSGSAYGDDVESDENYPIVQFTNKHTGDVYYARTSNWTSTGVATGPLVEQVDFTVPPGMTHGPYTLVVIGAGISSDPINASGIVNKVSGTTTFDTSPFGTVSAVTASGSASPGLTGVSLAPTSQVVVSNQQTLGFAGSGLQTAASVTPIGLPPSAPTLFEQPATGVADLPSQPGSITALDALFATNFDDGRTGLSRFSPRNIKYRVPLLT